MKIKTEKKKKEKGRGGGVQGRVVRRWGVECRERKKKKGKTQSEK